MAKKASLNLEVDVVNNTASGLKEVEENVAEVADNMGKSAKKPTKDWGGVLELFTGALPRGFQKSIRQFKSVRRSVGRLSKSFKLLKISIAALGLPALILGIEALASNWQSVTDFLGFTNKAQREAQEEFEATSETIATINQQGDEYLKIIRDSKTQTDVFNEAVAELNKTFGNAIDTEADLNKQKRQALDLSRAKKALDLAEFKAQEAKNKIIAKEKMLADERNKAEGEQDVQKILDLNEELRHVRANLIGYTQDALKAEIKLNEMIGKTTDAIKKREEEAKDADKEKKKTEAEAEKEEQERIRKAEQNAEFLANKKIEIENETNLLLISDAEKRADEELRIRQKAEMDQIKAAGATNDMIRDLNMLHLQQQADIEADRQAIKDEEKKAKEDAEIEAQQRLMDELDMMAMSEQDRRIVALADEYTKRKELAEGNAALLMQIEEQYSADLIALNEETEEEKAKAVSQAQDMLVKNSRSMFAALEKTAEEGSAAQKGFAIADVLLQQAVAMANAVAGATKAAKDTGPAAPFTLAAYIASMIGTVVGSFVSIKGILAEADAPSPGVGGGTVTATRPLIPTAVARTETAGAQNIQSFVVQSELQGASLINDNLYGQTSLNPG